MNLGPKCQVLVHHRTALLKHLDDERDFGCKSCMLSESFQLWIPFRLVSRHSLLICLHKVADMSTRLLVIVVVCFTKLC